VTALGRHHHVVRPGTELRQGLGDEHLVVPELALVAAVGVGGVDQGDAVLDGGADRRDPPLLVVGRTHRHRHRAEPDRADGPVTEASRLHGPFVPDAA
jgi:hypothetical protein